MALLLICCVAGLNLTFRDPCCAMARRRAESLLVPGPAAASGATHERTEIGRRLQGRQPSVRRSRSGRRRVGRRPRQEHVSETCSELPDTFGPAWSGSFDSLPFGGRRRVYGNRDALAVRRSIPIPHTTPLGTSHGLVRNDVFEVAPPSAGSPSPNHRERSNHAKSHIFFFPLDDTLEIARRRAAVTWSPPRRRAPGASLPLPAAPGSVPRFAAHVRSRAIFSSEIRALETSTPI